MQTLQTKLPRSLAANTIFDELNAWFYVKSIGVLSYMKSFKPTPPAKKGTAIPLMGTLVNFTINSDAEILKYFTHENEENSDILFPFDNSIPADDLTDEEITALAAIVCDIYEFTASNNAIEVTIPVDSNGELA